jgi:hypothetical protein
MYFIIGLFVVIFVWMHILQKEIIRQRIELKIKSATQLYHQKRVRELNDKAHGQKIEKREETKGAQIPQTVYAK